MTDQHVQELPRQSWKWISGRFDPGWGVRDATCCSLVGGGAALPIAAVAQSCTAPAVASYAGALFGAMAQTGQSLDGETAIAASRSVGVTRIVLFARVHNVEDGRNLVASMTTAHPDVVILGSPKLFDMRGDLAGSYVRDVLAGVMSRQYKFVGEVLYAHGDKSGGEVTAKGERYIDPTQPNTQRLVAGLGGMHVPVWRSGRSMTGRATGHGSTDCTVHFRISFSSNRMPVSAQPNSSRSVLPLTGMAGRRCQRRRWSVPIEGMPTRRRMSVRQ
jgi:hypothetical protein